MPARGTRPERPDTARALGDFYADISIAQGFPYGLQHVLAMFVANLAPISIVAAAAGMDALQSAALIQNALLMAGLGTIIQLFPLWRVGGALPIVTGISFTYVSAVVAIVAAQGYGAAVGAIIVGGLIEGALGLTVRYWRRAVPPIVSAVVVTSIGFSLLSVGAESFGGGSGAEDFGSWQNLLLGLVSLVACLAFQSLAKGTRKQLSVLFGLAVGYVLALMLGKVDLSAFQGLAPISIPQVLPVAPEFDLGAIISIGLLYLVSSVEVMGNTTALAKVGFDREPTDREMAGAITADGVVSSVAGVFGCLPITSFSQNVGLVAMTRVVNRRVIACGGAILILSAFVPAIAAVFNSLPEAVLGGCTVMMFGNIVLSGAQMIADAGFTQRNIQIAALALAAGIGFTQVQGIFAAFPPIVQSIFGSNCIAVAFVVAVVANLLLPRTADED
ncbi:nucleobase:cation symporter-2 family protein [Enorma burkinafasonensis]|uniref:nucleobase:cation symporter-2 family protein n=1 Tax=Enorma burkinafasonensis TaxID=2590867 RepID=UPI0026E97AF5|nr:nucleobase:cation symporter-2 family protein [Enorma burkinafasonensis]MCI7729934.1 purine permease [Enorma burkinafasonensis]